MLKDHQYKCLIKALPANVLNVICGCPFFVLFWASKKGQIIFIKAKKVTNNKCHEKTILDINMISSFKYFL